MMNSMYLLATVPANQDISTRNACDWDCKWLTATQYVFICICLVWSVLMLDRVYPIPHTSLNDGPVTSPLLVPLIRRVEHWSLFDRILFMVTLTTGAEPLHQPNNYASCTTALLFSRGGQVCEFASTFRCSWNVSSCQLRGPDGKYALHSLWRSLLPVSLSMALPLSISLFPLLSLILPPPHFSLSLSRSLFFSPPPLQWW